MQRKLKAVFRSSNKRKSQNLEESAQHSGATPPRSSQSVDRRAASVEVQRRPQTSDPYTGSAHQNGHRRNVSSGYDSHRMSSAAKAQPVAVDYAQSHHPTQESRDSIISDYKAYLPALAPADDSRDEQHTTLRGDRRLITEESALRHEEDVANRNIDRYRNSQDESKRRSIPATPGMCIDQSTVLPEAVIAITMKNYVNGFAVRDVQGQDTTGMDTQRGSVGSVPSLPMSTATGASGKYSLGQDTATKGGLIDSILPHTEAAAHEKNHWKNKSWPSKTARAEPQEAWSKRRPRGSESEDGGLHSPSDDLANHHPIPFKSQSALNGTRIAGNKQDEIGREIEQLLDGVVDLRNTVDEDKDVRWAPGMLLTTVEGHCSSVTF
jgi:hypothetical protein